MPKINLVQLEQEIENMNNTHLLYKCLKRSLTRLGHWQNLPRGNPKKGFQASLKSRGQY